MSFPGIMGEEVTECVLMQKTRVPDGEGGWNTSWTDGPSFYATITHDTTINARIAESEGMMATYTVYTEKAMPLDFHDVFRRVHDGQYFRVTSDGTDVVTPKRASFALSQVAAEEWTLE